MQIQLRDIPGFVETRHQLLILKPANRNNWITFAVAHHLNKNYELALEVSTEVFFGCNDMFTIRARHTWPITATDLSVHRCGSEVASIPVCCPPRPHNVRVL